MIFVILIWWAFGLFAVSCCCYCTFALVYSVLHECSFNCAVSERHRRPFKLILLNTETEIWNNFYFLVNNNNNKTKSFWLSFFDKAKSDTSTHSVVGHVSGSGAELGVWFDDLVNGFQEIFLCGDLPAGPDGKHSCLGAHAADLGTWKEARFKRVLRLSES